MRASLCRTHGYGAGVAAAKTPAVELEVGEHDRPRHQPGQGLLPEPRGAPSSTSSSTTCRSATASLRALRERPTTLQRFPEGVEGEAFYQKRFPQYGAPDWLDTVRDHVPERPARRRALRHPSGGRGLGGQARHRSCSTHGRREPPTSTIPTSCASTSTLSPAPTSTDAHRGAGDGAADARRARLGRLSEDLRRPRHSRLPPHRAAMDLHRGTPRRHRVRARDRAPRCPIWSPPRGGRRSAANASSSTSTRTPATARSRRRTACGDDQTRRSPTPLTWDELPTVQPEDFTLRHRAAAVRRARRRARRDRRRAALDSNRCSSGTPATSAIAASATCPTRPNYPKMPGEPKRVQPSKDRDRKAVP